MINRSSMLATVIAPGRHHTPMPAEGAFTPTPFHVDGPGIQRVLEVRRMVLLDHLHAGPAVLGDLVDLRASRGEGRYRCGGRYRSSACCPHGRSSTCNRPEGASCGLAAKNKDNKARIRATRSRLRHALWSPISRPLSCAAFIPQTSMSYR